MNVEEIELIALKKINLFFNPLLAFLFLFLINFTVTLLPLFLYFFWRKKEKINFFQLTLSSLVGLVLVFFLKYSIKRPRPYYICEELKILFKKTDPSFPSFHSFLSILLLNFIPKNLKAVKIFSLIYFLFLVPFGLLYMEFHYPSDIFFGGFIGWIFPKIFNKKLIKKLI